MVQTTDRSDFAEKHRVLRRFRLGAAVGALVRHFRRCIFLDNMTVEQHVHYNSIESSAFESFNESLFYWHFTGIYEVR